MSGTDDRPPRCQSCGQPDPYTHHTDSYTECCNELVIYPDSIIYTPTAWDERGRACAWDAYDQYVDAEARHKRGTS